MNSRIGLCIAGLVTVFMPGCCVFEHVFQCKHFGGGDQCGAVADGCGHSKKCSKKCRKCMECLQEHGGGMYPALGYLDGGFVEDGGCGCGGHDGGMITAGYGGGDTGCGCSQGGGNMVNVPMMSSPVMTTPTMTVPTPAPAPTPMGGTALPPPIPPAETSSLPQLPPGTQQVSVEEFQRLPGVVISGPTAPSVASTPQAAPAIVTSPATSPTVISTAPVNAKQVQQTGWAPVRR